MYKVSNFFLHVNCIKFVRCEVLRYRPTVCCRLNVSKHTSTHITLKVSRRQTLTPREARHNAVPFLVLSGDRLYTVYVTITLRM